MRNHCRGAEKDIADLDTGIQHQKTRKDKLDASIDEENQDVYDECATEVPDTKAVSRKNLVSKKVLDTPVATVFKRYLEKFPGSKVSQSKFYTLGPKNIMTSKTKKLFQSRCEYCTNAKLKLDTLNKLCEEH